MYTQNKFCRHLNTLPKVAQWAVQGAFTHHYQSEFTIFILAPKIIFKYPLTFMKEHYFVPILRDSLSYTASRIWPYLTFTGGKKGVKLATHIFVNFPGKQQY
jgi:hypothetical protein